MPMLGTAVHAWVIVVVAEIPRCARGDQPTAAPASRLAGLHGWLDQGAEPLMRTAVS